MSHQIYWRDPNGNLLTIISNFIRLEYGRGEGKVGWLTLDLDPDTLPVSYLAVNSRLEPWRSVGALPPYLDGETVFFLRVWKYRTDSAGVEMLHLEAYDPIYLLDGHIVAYAAGSAQADRTNEADDMMKSIVRDNLGADATDTARSLATWMTVQVDTTLAPSTTKAFSRRNVLTVLQELAFESYQGGTYLAFDIVYTAATTLEFRTYTGQRGINHGRTAAQPVIISRERRNLEEPVSSEDHSEEFNYIYAGGQGEEANRVIKTASTADALGLNRREYFVDARNDDADASVQAEADAALYDNRSRKSLEGRIIDVDGCLYGVHYRFGDLVYAEYRGQGYDAHIDAILVTVEGGRETVDCHIRGGV